MPKIFICYRRDDALESASRLHETLTRCFGAEHIFWDHDSISAGTIFRVYIQNAINSSTTFLAVIGRDWLTIERDGKRLLDDPKDIVRWEIVTALEREDNGEDIRVIPILVEGALCPSKQDLPEVLQKLVEHQCIEIRSQKWREDVNPLIQLIENDFKPNFLYTFLGGAIAGLIAGVIVGWVYYYYRIDPTIGVGRIFIGGLYGLFSGAILSYFINSGITWRSRLLNKSPYSKIIGGTVGGAVGGILAGVAGGFLFDPLEGEKLDPKYLILAVAGTSMFVALGILLPELKGVWHKTALLIIILMCVTLVAASITISVFDRFIGFAGSYGFPFSKGVLILGSICGIMSGCQVGSILFVYDRFKNKLGNNP